MQTCVKPLQYVIFGFARIGGQVAFTPVYKSRKYSTQTNIQFDIYS